MHRIDADGHVLGSFANGDASLGVAGTKVDAAWLNAVQGEIVNLLEGMGVTLVKNTNTQLATELGVRSPRAWANVRTGGTSPILKSGCVIGTPSYQDAGLTLRIPFSSSLPDTDYSVFLFVDPGAEFVPFVYDKQTGRIDVRVVRPTVDAGVPTTGINHVPIDLSATAVNVNLLVFNS